MRFENFWPKLCKFCNFGQLYDGQIWRILNKNTRFGFYIFNVNDYLIRKGLCHVKDKVPIYHLTESLFKIIDFLVTSILLKSCDKIWSALDRAHHTIQFINMATQVSQIEQMDHTVNLRLFN